MFSFKGAVLSEPLAPLPRSASVKGHEWALPEMARPECFLRHAWRANFTASLRSLCTVDSVISSVACRHGWQIFPKGV